MEVPQTLLWELVVVDNNSNDATRRVVAEYSQQADVPVKYVLERNQGKSHALKAGIQMASGEILAFTDDDVRVGVNWIKELFRTFELYKADCVGGKILPVWPGPRPAWLTSDLDGMLALVDYGNAVQEIAREHHLLFGANLAFVKDIFDQESFNTNFGPKGRKLYNNEETDLLRRIIRSGRKVIYQPQAVIEHVIQPYKLKKAYFRKWFFDNGEGQGLALGLAEGRSFLGVPFYSVRELCSAFSNYVGGVVRKSGTFRDELNLWRSLGFTWGRLKYYFVTSRSKVFVSDSKNTVT
jgi:glycosyltransferase involved in cell wall biosynthesis